MMKSKRASLWPTLLPSLLLALLLTLVVANTQAATITAFASFDSNGVQGEVKFVQVDGGDVSVSIALTGLINGESMPYHIHKFPVDRLSGSCDAKSTSGHYDPFGKGGMGYTCDPGTPSECELGDLSGIHGNLVGAGATEVVASYTNNFIDLSGKYSIIGRSIVIHRADGSRYACADIIQETNEDSVVEELIANFVDGPIYGRFVFKKVDGGDTLGYYDLHSVGNEGPYKYHIHRSPVASPNDCLSTGDHFDPLGANTGGKYFCDPNDFSTCEIGDLSAKFGEITPDVNGFAKGVFTDDTLDLLNGYMIIGASIVIHNASGARIACANIVHPKVVATFTGEKGIYGEITIARVNGGKSVQIDVALNNLNYYRSYPYHIHTKGVYAETDCASANAHFDPFNANHGAYNCSKNDFSTCEVGDISAKFSNLESDSSFFSASHTDNTIVVTDVIYRSFVIHESDGSRFTCANIVSQDDEHLQATASVVDPTNNAVEGRVMFSQINHGPTNVLVKVKGLANGKEYPYHVHVTPVDENGSCEAAATGGHYDPFGANTGESYNCNPVNHITCEVGDLSGKWGNLVGVSSASTYVISRYQDSRLAMSGQYSIIGRSIVIHSGSARYLCANIVPKILIGAPVFEAIVTYDSPSQIKGNVLFRQVGEQGDVSIFINVETSVTAELTYHVHEFPIATPSNCDAAGGHLDPYRVGGTGYSCDPNDFSTCEVGDVSGRQGKLKATNGKIRALITDPVLSLNGPHSIVGLSMVFHNGSPRIACGNISPAVLVVRFDGKVRGAITFENTDEQGVKVTGAFEEGLASGKSYNYHIHTNKVSSSTSCAAAAGHYDPYDGMISGETYYCHPLNGDVGCEVGDLSNKHGSISGNAVFAYIDKSLSVFDILGRSVVIHNPDNSRLICANINLSTISHLDVPPSSLPYRKTAGFGALIMLIMIVLVIGGVYVGLHFYKKQKGNKSKQLGVEMESP